VSKQERQLLDDLRAKSVEAAADMMSGLQRLKSLHEEVAGEDFDADRARLGDFLYKLAKLELEHASNILSLGNVQAEMLFEQARRLARRARGASGPQQVLDIVVVGGQPASGRFEIKNPYDHEADARFVITKVADESGETRDDVKLKPRCEGALLPHGSATVIVEATCTTKAGVRFAELTVLVSSAHFETDVARRIVKVKVKEPST
jgi:hypothetical protein